jgi:hypothetical protein
MAAPALRCRKASLFEKSISKKWSGEAHMSSPGKESRPSATPIYLLNSMA